MGVAARLALVVGLGLDDQRAGDPAARQPPRQHAADQAGRRPDHVTCQQFA